MGGEIFTGFRHLKTSPVAAPTVWSESTVRLYYLTPPGFTPGTTIPINKVYVCKAEVLKHTLC